MYDQKLGNQLMAFLDGKDPEETYIYALSCICAAAQFNKSVGREYPLVSSLADRIEQTTVDGLLEGLAQESPQTFGALRDRVSQRLRPRILEDA